MQRSVDNPLVQFNRSLRSLLALFALFALLLCRNAAAITTCPTQAPVVTVAMSATSGTAPASVSLTATATGERASNCVTYPVTSVQYVVNGSTVATVTTAPYSYTLSNLAAGTYSIYAIGVTTMGTGVSVTQTFTSNAATTTPASITLTSPSNGASYTAPASVGMTATASGGSYSISSVNYYNGSTLLGSGSGSNWAYTASGLSAGSYAISAKVTTSGGTTATSGISTITVSNASVVKPSISLTAPANAAKYTAPASVPMSVSVTQGTYPISSVSYYNGSTLLGNGTSPSWSYTASNLAAGTYAISAKVTDSQGNTATSGTDTITVSSGATVNPSITLTAPSNGATYTAPASIPMSVSVTQGTYPISSVSYYNGSTLLGSGTSPSWSYTASNLAAGSYAISAKVTDSQGNSATSGTDTVTVNSAVSTAPSVTMSGPVDGATIAPSTPTTLTVSANAGSYTMSSVSYYSNGGTLLGSATSSPYSYTLAAGLAAGSYSIYAVANTTTSGISATSAPIIVTVGTGTGAAVSSATPLAVNVTPPSLNNAPGGTLPGNLAVNGGGGASYIIPLSVPPGVRGIEPDLTLNYNSQGTNGMLGLGWTLGGLSAIHRCNKTLAQDGTTSGVNFTHSDRLCLDGQRLILVSSPTSGNADNDYWAVGATYSTEIANFSRITSYMGAHGLAFKVESKAGRVLYYGDQGDGTSYINAQGRSDGQALLWALGQVQDLMGNYYTISYSNNLGTGEYLPTQINYGMNSTLGSSPDLSVIFNYNTARPDSTIRYVAGSHNDMVSLLTSIQAYTGYYNGGTATKVREYDINYASSPSSARSMIQSVQMQALNPQTKAMVAFPATTFDMGQSAYQAPSFTQAGAVGSGPVAPPPYPMNCVPAGSANYCGPLANTAQFDQLIWADFNGDGLTDALAVDMSQTPYKFYIYLAKAGGGFDAPVLWTPSAADWSTIVSRSANGYKMPTGGAYNHGVIISGRWQATWGVSGDFDGDGSSDLFLFGSFVCISQMKTNPAAGFGSCIDTTLSSSNTAQSGVGQSWYPADYMVLNTSGQGTSDLFMRGGTNADGTRCVSVMQSGAFQGFNCQDYVNTDYVITGNFLNEPGHTYVAGDIYVQNYFGDFNGDGLQDVYRIDATSFNATTSMVEICLSTPQQTANTVGFNCQTNWLPAGFQPVGFSNGGATVSVYNNTAGAPISPVQGESLLADVNGDGMTDLIVTGFDSNNTYNLPSGNVNGYYPLLCYSTGVNFDCHNLTLAGASTQPDVEIMDIAPISSDGAVKTITYEFNDAGSGGVWRSCLIQNSSLLNCQTISGGLQPAVIQSLSGSIYASNAIIAAPIAMLGNFLNDGSLNVAFYNQTLDNVQSAGFPSNGVSNSSAWTMYSISQGAHVAIDKLNAVTNGIGRISSVTYSTGGQAAVYTEYPAAGLPSYPNQSVANPGWLVSALNDTNGQGGTLETTYAYQGQLSDAWGRGSLGFSSVTVTKIQTQPVTDPTTVYNLQTVTNYLQNWPYVGMVASSSVAAVNSAGGLVQTLSSTNNSTAGNSWGLVSLPSAYYSANAGLIPGLEIANCVICYPYLATSSTQTTDLGGQDLGTVMTIVGSVDNYGDQGTVTVSSKLASDATWFSTLTTNSWYPATPCVTSPNSSYLIGKLCSSTVRKANETASYLGNQSGAIVTRSVNYQYDNKGFLSSEVLESGVAGLQVSNIYTADYQVNGTGVGNAVSMLQSWTDPASGSILSRMTATTYTSDGRFVASKTNPMGLTESYQTDSATGARTQLTDVNGLVTNWTVDGVGRTLSQTLPNTNVTNWAYNQCLGDCPPYATAVTIETHYNNSTAQTSGVPKLSYTNPLGQLIRTMSYGFDGTPIMTDHLFDTLARPLADFQPEFAAGAFNGAALSYPSGMIASERTGIDTLNRTTALETLNEAGGAAQTTTTYSGATRTIVNANQESRVETRDVLGQLISVVDNATGINNAPSATTSFAHDPYGSLTQTTDPAGNLIKVTYDAMGRKIQTIDPDLGTINYSVDPVGRTWKQISPNEAAAGHATTFQFDLLDRMISRIEPDLTSYFTYDVSGAAGAPLSAAQISSCQSTRSCGKMVESYTAPLTGNTGLVNSGNTAKESDTVFHYDSLGRPSNNTLTLDAGIGMTFYNETDYDAWSRPVTIISQHGSDPQKIYQQRYNQYGYLQSIQRAGLTLWQVTTQDAMNRIVTARLATAGGASDGLISTHCYNTYSGRLTRAAVAPVTGSVPCSSTPSVETVAESYSYDAIGNVGQRNEAWNQGINGTTATQSFGESFTYDGLNRIASSTVQNQAQQTYTYTVDGSVLSKTGVGTYTYAGGSSGGAHAVKSIATPSNGTMSFGYDADGNQLSGNNRTNVWTSFDMPSSLSYTGAGSQFSSTASAFAYGPYHERRAQTQGSTAIIYYGNSQEVQTDLSHNIVSIKTYWPHGIGVEIDRPSQNASELDWMHADNLGSMVAITDALGNLKEALGYDAWGSRRNPNGVPVSVATESTAAIKENTDNKGYTGQEQLDSLELVHMNGRVYDALLGKFLSGDPLVRDPDNGQNYNRYAYVLNNPTNMNDPTGFESQLVTDGSTTLNDLSSSMQTGDTATYSDGAGGTITLTKNADGSFSASASGFNSAGNPTQVSAIVQVTDTPSVGGGQTGASGGQVSSVGSADGDFNKGVNDEARQKQLKAVKSADLFTSISAAGDSEQNFILVTARRMDKEALDSKFENCGMMCSMQSDGGTIFGVAIHTNFSHIGCIVAPVCPAGMTPINYPGDKNRSIHTHGSDLSVVANIQDDVISDGKYPKLSRISGQDRNNFSDTDLDGMDGYLATDDKVKLHVGKAVSDVGTYKDCCWVGPR